MDTKFVALLAETFGLRATEITPNLKKTDVDSWDSLKQMDLLLSLERQYNIVLDIQDIIRMISVSSIIDVLKEKGINIGN